MRTLLNLIKAADALQLEAILATAMETGGPTYVQQVKEQLYDGLRPDGRAITPPYAPATVEYKRWKGQPTNRVTLKDTGAFYSGIYADPQGEKMYVDSRDSKSNALQEKYGDDVLELGGEYRMPYHLVLENNMLEQLHKNLQL